MSYHKFTAWAKYHQQRCAVDTCRHVHNKENKHNEWKIWPKNTYLIWWSKLCYKTKTVENLRNGIKHHTYLKLFTCHPCMYISAIQKLKLKENYQNSDCVTSHHLGEWKTILQFGGKSGILLLLGSRFSPRFHNPRTLWQKYLDNAPRPRPGR